MQLSFKIFLLPASLIFFQACSTPITIPKATARDNPPDMMHAWLPPSEIELERRRNQQKWLDKIATEIESLFFIKEGLLQQTRSLESSMNQFAMNVDNLQPQWEAEVAHVQQKQETLKKTVTGLQTSSKIIRSQLAGIKQQKSRNNVKPGKFKPGKVKSGKVKSRRKAFRRKLYTAAIRSFRDGDYRESIRLFKVALDRNPPTALRDNIYFGLGASWFKLNDFSAAGAPFKTIVNRYPRGDKWLISHVMLGLTHQLNGETSQALFFLQQAKSNNPPKPLRDLIDRLLDGIQNETLRAVS